MIDNVDSIRIMSNLENDLTGKHLSFPKHANTDFLTLLDTFLKDVLGIGAEGTGL